MSLAFTTFRARRLALERQAQEAERERQRPMPIGDLVEESICESAPERRLPRDARITAYEKRIAQVSVELLRHPIGSPEYVLLRQKRSAMIHNMRKLKRFDATWRELLASTPEPDRATCTVEDLYRYYVGGMRMGSTGHPWTVAACIDMGLAWLRCCGTYPKHRDLDSDYNMPGEGPIRRFWPILHEYHCALADAAGRERPTRSKAGRPITASHWHGTEAVYQ